MQEEGYEFDWIGLNLRLVDIESLSYFRASLRPVETS